ncbi:MAG: FAD-binding oxidoreductase [Planctomycetota bacterium]
MVVGGGIIGCCLAYCLARAGRRVVLLERDAIAGATSGCCMGHLMVVPEPGPMLSLTLAGVRLWKDFHAELGGFELNARGALWLAETAADIELLEQVDATLREAGVQGQQLRNGAIRELEPGLAEDLPAAFLLPEDGVLMPMLAAGAVLRAAIELGADVRPFTPARGVERDRDGAIDAVLTDQGAIATPTLIIAAGVWSPEVAAWAGLPDLAMRPRRGDLAITMPRETPVQHQLLEVGYLRTTGAASGGVGASGPDPGAHAVNVQPQTHGTCLIGSTRQFAGFARDVSSDLLQRSLQRAARFVPGLGGARITRTWAGLRPYSADKRPLIGRVTAVPGLWLCTGHEGLGITLAGISAKVVTEQLLGAEPSVPVEAFAPDRFAVAPGAQDA